MKKDVVDSKRVARSARGFTLVELLTVIAIIAVLMGLLFPAVGGVKDAARKAQAKNDLVQIVAAVKNYQTDYSRYPVDTAAGGGSDKDYADDNNKLFWILRGKDQSSDSSNLNPRQLSFIEIPTARKQGDRLVGGLTAADDSGKYVDPWGDAYRVRIDGNYDNEVDNPYSNAGVNPLQTGCIAWSLGKDKEGGSGDKETGKAADDVISWQ